MGSIDRFNAHNEHPIHPFRQEMERMMSRFFDSPFFRGDSSLFQPAFNLKEHEGHYHIEAELPGISPEDIQIEAHGNTLTIRGEKHRKKEQEQEGQVHMVESQYGSFRRVITLPSDADMDGITADSDNGILHITVPKDQKQAPRRIEIQNKKRH